MTMQQTIIQELGVKPEIDPEIEVTNRVNFLKDYLIGSKLGGFVLGLSGGQDSLLAGCLIQKAVNAAVDEGYKASFHAMLLPYGQQKDADDARLAVDFIHPDYTHELNIKTPTDALAAEFKAATGQDLSDFDKGNVKARMRMLAQYAIAGNYHLLVVGTDHAAEAVTGFFTKFGDGGADILPLSGLTKGQSKQILKHLGAPGRLYTKAPTADLLDDQPDRPDEDELGISYEMIDAYLTGQPVAPEIAKTLEAVYRATEHKRALPVAYRY